MKKIGDWNLVKEVINNLPKHAEILVRLNPILENYRRTVRDIYPGVEINLWYDELKDPIEAVKGHKAVIGLCTPSVKNEIKQMLNKHYPNIQFYNNY